MTERLAKGDQVLCRPDVPPIYLKINPELAWGTVYEVTDVMDQGHAEYYWVRLKRENGTVLPGWYQASLFMGRIRIN